MTVGRSRILQLIKVIGEECLNVIAPVGAFENLLISSSRFQWYLFRNTGGKNVIAYLILQTLGVTMVLHVSILLIQFNFEIFLDIIACNLSTNLVYFDFKYFQNKLSEMYSNL